MSRAQTGRRYTMFSAGQGSFRAAMFDRLRHPDAVMERKIMEYVGDGFTMLADRRGGTGKKPMTLDSFRDRVLAEPSRELEYTPGESGCGCFGAAT